MPSLSGAGQITWIGRLSEACNQLLANPRFQRWAFAFPLTRPIARRQSRALFDLCAGFVYSQILLACVRLRLFSILAEGPQSIADLAGRLALSADSAERLLAAAATLRLVERREGDCYGLAMLGALLADNPAIAAMIEHNALLYEDLQDPVALLRGKSETQLARYWPYADAPRPETLPSGAVASYSDLMSASQPLVAAEIFDAYSLDRHSCLMDVGGGDGTFIAAVARRAPSLRLILVDLPAVADRARRRLGGLGLASRVRCIGQNAVTDPLPDGADIVTLVRVLHDHDEPSVLAILRAVRRSLRSGGAVLVAEPMADAPGAAPVGAAYFGFYLLAMGRGRPRSAATYMALLREAGFRAAKPVRTRNPLAAQLILGSV
jgi:demethylspheroidene O-methyltransferase